MTDVFAPILSCLGEAPPSFGNIRLFALIIGPGEIELGFVTL